MCSSRTSKNHPYPLFFLVNVFFTSNAKTQALYKCQRPKIKMYVVCSLPKKYKDLDFVFVKDLGLAKGVLSNNLSITIAIISNCFL
jgi:hypothetical protein